MKVGRLHVLTDETLQSRFSHREIAQLAACAGADTVQLREKRAWDTARLLATARELRCALEEVGVALIVDDRTDVAAAAGAHGVHLGPRDLPAAWARALLGPGALIGATVHDAASAGRAAAGAADYVGVGPVFPTTSKGEAAPALGLSELRRIVAAAGRPVIAIGGITPERVGDVLDAGAHGIAVLSAVTCAPDPAAAVGRFADALSAALAWVDERRAR